MIKITYSDKTTAEIPAEVYKNNVFVIDRNVTKLFIPKEVKNIRIYKKLDATGFKTVSLEEGLKKIYLVNFNCKSVKIPLSCKTLYLKACNFDNLFVPKNVILLNIYENCVMGNLWIDGKYTYANFGLLDTDYYINNDVNSFWMHSDRGYLCSGISTKTNIKNINIYNIRFHPEYFKEQRYQTMLINYSYSDNYINYNIPLTRNINIIGVKDSKFYQFATVCKDSEFEKIPEAKQKITKLTKEQYFEKFGEGNCPFMPDYEYVNPKDELKKKYIKITELYNIDLEKPDFKRLSINSISELLNNYNTLINTLNKIKPLKEL